MDHSSSMFLTKQNGIEILVPSGSIPAAPSLIIAGGLRIAVTPANEKYPRGYGKAEALAGIVAALALLGSAIAERQIDSKITCGCAYALSLEATLVQSFSRHLKEAEFRNGFRFVGLDYASQIGHLS